MLIIDESGWLLSVLVIPYIDVANWHERKRFCDLDIATDSDLVLHGFGTFNEPKLCIDKEAQSVGCLNGG